MRSCLAGLSVALVPAALLFAALPASANHAESQPNFSANELDPSASTLEADGEPALTAAAELDAAAQLQQLRATLSERKARLDMIGEDAADRLDGDKHPSRLGDRRTRPVPRLARNTVRFG